MTRLGKSGCTVCWFRMVGDGRDEGGGEKVIQMKRDRKDTHKEVNPID